MAAVTKGTVKGLSKLLDMSHGARRKRAKGLGFDPDEVWYHGTDKQFDEFDTTDRTLDFVGTPNNAGDNLGVFFAKNKNHSKYFGPNVGAYNIRSENPKVFKTQDDWRNFIREHNYQKPDIRDEEGFIVEEGGFHVGARKALEDAGHDSVLIERPGFTKTKQSDQPWLVALDSSKIRSVNAAFDPAKKESRNLLASLAPVGIGTTVAAGGLLAPEDAEASFVGEGAQGIYKGIIAAARKMADEGLPREEIWQKTWDMGGGAYKGPDGKWRVEVDDTQAAWTPARWRSDYTDDGQYVGDFSKTKFAFRSPLLDAYPTLGDMEVGLTPNIGPGAEYVPENAFFETPEAVNIGRSRLGEKEKLSDWIGQQESPQSPNYWKGQARRDFEEGDFESLQAAEEFHLAELNRDKTSYEDLRRGLAEPASSNTAKSAMLHELQHAIQGRENFAKGGSPAMARTVRDELRDTARSAYGHAEAIAGGRLLDMETELADKFKDISNYNAFRKLTEYAEYPEPTRIKKHIVKYADYLHSPEFRDVPAADELKRRLYEMPKSNKQKRAQFLRDWAYDAGQLFKKMVPEDVFGVLDDVYFAIGIMIMFRVVAVYVSRLLVPA